MFGVWIVSLCCELQVFVLEGSQDQNLAVKVQSRTSNVSFILTWHIRLPVRSSIQNRHNGVRYTV